MNTISPSVIIGAEVEDFSKPETKMSYFGINEISEEHMAIEIDLQRDENFDESSHIQFKRGNYLLPTENHIQEGLARASIAYASNPEHAQRIYDYVSEGWFMFASPVLSSAANKRGCPISCFLSDVEDSREEISKAWMETMWLSTEGGGVGMNWSKVRSAGEKTSRGTYTPGLIPFLKATDAITLASIQGSVRRGASAVYLDVSHPEIIEFIESRRATGGDSHRKLMNIHNAVNISDAFMVAVEKDDLWELVDPHSKKVKDMIKARDLWRRILEIRLETGEPYIHFIDRSNEHLPASQKALGLRVNNSNLCVAPETPILTEDYGWRAIQDLEDEHVNIWNGEEWSEVTVRQTAASAPLLRVNFSDGSSIDCTHHHKFYIQEDYWKKAVVVPAGALEPGMKLEKFELPLLPPTTCAGAPFNKEAYSQGFYSGDGNKNRTFSWIYAPKYDCIPYLTGDVGDEYDTVERKRWIHGEMKSKAFVPVNGETAEVLCWLAGRLDADGCVIESNHGQNIQMVSIDKSHLHKIKLMLQRIGVSSSVGFRRAAGAYFMPTNDGTGSEKEYDCNELWLLNINGSGVKALVSYGLPVKRLKLSKTQCCNRDASRFVTVLNIEDTGRMDRTFCFTEQKRGKGMFNGILTGNCSEITLPTNKDRTAVCCLSSINLEKYDEWKDNPLFVGDLIEMLDNVLTVFIKKAPPELSKAVYSATQERALGLGTLGFHSYLQKHNIPFEGAVASGQNRRIFNHIKIQAEAASLRLGELHGEAPDMKGTGRRNSHLLAIAPNASSSILCNNVSPSIEPYNANIFTQKTGNGVFIIKNKALDYLLKTKYRKEGDELEAVWDSILFNEGSVSHLEWMEKHDKDVFKTAFELDQRWIIDHACARQTYICQGQSVNIFVLPGTPAKTYSALHFDAWKGGLKCLYYVRSKNVGKAAKTNADSSNVVPIISGASSACLSCEG